MQENLKSNQESINLNNEIIRKKAANKKMKILNFIFIIAVFTGLAINMKYKDGMDNIIELLHSVDYKWVLAGVGCLLVHWLCDSLNLYIPIKRMYPTQTFKNSFKVAMIGQLFNNITPFATGGQPMQAYELTKTGKKVSDSLSAMIIKFIVTQIALVSCTIVVALFQLEFFKRLIRDYLFIAVLGFSVNIIAIVLAILIGIKKQIIIKIVIPIIKFLGRIHILKNPEETLQKVIDGIENFSEQFIVMKSEKKMVIKMFLVAIVQSFAYYSITYMIYRAFGNSGITIWQIIPIQAFLLLIMMFVPTPGSGLGAEGGFYLLFNSVFKEGTINMSILFWRIYTFYLPILVDALFLIPTKNKDNKGK